MQECGTHSILDMFRVVADGEEPDYGTVQPVAEAEALERVGVAKLTRAHVEALEPLANRSSFGRCAVLHDAAGNPEEIYFWGYSGDRQSSGPLWFRPRLANDGRRRHRVGPPGQRLGPGPASGR